MHRDFLQGDLPYEGFFKKVIEEQLNIDLAGVTKFDIKGSSFVIFRKGKSKREVAVDFLNQFAFSPCRLCLDYTAELADISIRSIGSPNGRSTMLLRSSIDREAFTQAKQSQELDIVPLEEVKPGIKAVKRASARKKNPLKKKLNEGGEKENPCPHGFGSKNRLRVTPWRWNQ